MGRSNLPQPLASIGAQICYTMICKCNQICTNWCPHFTALQVQPGFCSNWCPNVTARQCIANTTRFCSNKWWVGINYANISNNVINVRISTHYYFQQLLTKWKLRSGFGCIDITHLSLMSLSLCACACVCGIILFGSFDLVSLPDSKKNCIFRNTQNVTTSLRWQKPSSSSYRPSYIRDVHYSVVVGGWWCRAHFAQRIKWGSFGLDSLNVCHAIRIRHPKISPTIIVSTNYPLHITESIAIISWWKISLTMFM